MAGEQSPFDRLATEGYVSTTLNGSLGAARSAFVSTLPRQLASNSVGAGIVSGTIFSALAICTLVGTYGRVRFCTGGTTPVLTDCRVGVWDRVTGTILAQSDNYSATVNGANRLYEIPLLGTLDLIVGQPVYIGLALIGTTIGTYFGVPGLAALNAIDPQITKIATGWVGGPLLNLSTTSSNGILWAELIP